MMDLLFTIGLSNVCISLALAIVALVVEITLKRPHLAYLLWLLVFVKLMMVPVITLPVQSIDSNLDDQAYRQQEGFQLEVSGDSQAAYLSAEMQDVVLEYGKNGLFILWVSGSALVLLWSLVRITRFNRLLKDESELAPPALQNAAENIGGRLGLGSIPSIFTTSANLTPMVWCSGGRVRIVLPSRLLEQMDSRQWQWVLAHELAHVRRRDYWVRWLEWMACVCFWWNPVVWWGRYHLRANEEICCDSLVLSTLHPQPHAYANSLLTAVECLTFPARQPPVMASEINSYGFLKRRFRVIVSAAPNRTNPPWLQACVLLFALVVLPLGITYAFSDEESAVYQTKQLERFDSDGDGKLSDKEHRIALEADRAAEWARMLEKYDSNSDGEVSEREYLDALEADRAAYRAMMLEKFDSDGDGKLSDREYLVAVEADQAAQRAQRLERLDTNGDGKISDKEQLAAEEARRSAYKAWMLAIFDDDGDGKLSDREHLVAEEIDRAVQFYKGGGGRRSVKEYPEKAEAERAQRRAQMLKRFDTNGDGKLSDKEQHIAAKAERAQRRARMLKRFDTNGDGKVTNHERREAAGAEGDDRIEANEEK